MQSTRQLRSQSKLGLTYLLIVVLFELDLVLLPSSLVKEPETDECSENHCLSAENLGTRSWLTKDDSDGNESIGIGWGLDRLIKRPSAFAVGLAVVREASNCQLQRQLDAKRHTPCYRHMLDRIVCLGNIVEPFRHSKILSYN